MAAIKLFNDEGSLMSLCTGSLQLGINLNCLKSSTLLPAALFHSDVMSIISVQVSVIILKKFNFPLNNVWKNLLFLK